MRILIPFSLLLLTACGSGGGGGQPGGSVAVSPVSSTQVSYKLIATREPDGSSAPASTALSQAMRIAFPAGINVSANTNDVNRVTLSLGSTYCDYQNNHDTVFARLDGSCNTFTPSDPVLLQAGDVISLSISTVPLLHTAAEADLTGNF